MLKLVSLLCCCYLAIASPVVRSSTVCAETPLSQSSNEFGFQLFKHLGKKNENVFVSPFSIYAALAMVHRGAQGRTADQLESVFQLKRHGLQGTQLQESFQKLLWSFHQKQDNYSLLVENALFLQNDFNVKSKYLEDLHKFFMAALKLVDFQHNGKVAMDDINQWVSENTKNKIEKLVSEPFDPSTVLAILNAVYFKGTWKVQFNKTHTREHEFYKNSIDDTKRVSLMQQHNEHYRFFNDRVTEYKFLELPYKGEDVVMLLALPIDFKQPADLELSSSLLCRINNNLRRTKLEDVVIPKFKLEYEKELSDVLKSLGIQDLFTSSANLSGISDGVQVSQVLHKAVVEVNEEGSEAAAVTSVIIKTKSALITDNTFVANHPFLFNIIDKRSGIVLFSGRVADP